MGAEEVAHHIEDVPALGLLKLVVVKAVRQGEVGPRPHILQSAGQVTGALLVTDPGLDPDLAGDPDRVPGHELWMDHEDIALKMDTW